MTIGPILIRRLRVAAAARALQGSAIGHWPSTGLSTWSQTNTPSSPASSAASAISPNATRSANAPNNGIVNPCRTTPDPSLQIVKDDSVATDHALGFGGRNLPRLACFAEQTGFFGAMSATRVVLFIDYQNMYHRARGSFGYESNPDPNLGHAHTIDFSNQLQDLSLVSGKPQRHTAHKKFRGA